MTRQKIAISKVNLKKSKAALKAAGYYEFALWLRSAIGVYPTGPRNLCAKLAGSFRTGPDGASGVLEALHDPSLWLAFLYPSALSGRPVHAWRVETAPYAHVRSVLYHVRQAVYTCTEGAIVTLDY